MRLEAGLCPVCLLRLALEATDGDEVDAATATPPLEAAYRILTLLDRGEQQTLYLAEQTADGSLVVIEVVQACPDSTPTREAFETRLEALQQLDHPGLAAVVDGRLTDSGRCCTVWRYVAGTPMARYCSERRLAPAERGRLFLALCDAVEYAHAHGIVHGRIRPDMVLVVERDGEARPLLAGLGVWRAGAASVADDVTGLGRVLAAIGEGREWAPVVEGATCDDPVRQFPAVVGLKRAVESLIASLATSAN